MDKINNTKPKLSQTLSSWDKPHNIDRQARPPWMGTKFFMLGIITAFGALFLELLLFTFFDLKIGAPYLFSNSLSWPIIFSAFLEEIVKFIVIFKVFKEILQKESEPKPVFFSSLFIGLGFSTTEIFFNLFNSQINRYFFWSDVIGLFTVHTTTLAILGFTLTKWPDLNWKKFALLLPLVFLVHLIYNYIVIYQSNSGLSFLFLLSSFILILVFSWNSRKNFKKGNLPRPEIGL